MGMKMAVSKRLFSQQERGGGEKKENLLSAMGDNLSFMRRRGGKIRDDKSAGRKVTFNYGSPLLEEKKEKKGKEKKKLVGVRKVIISTYREGAQRKGKKKGVI